MTPQFNVRFLVDRTTPSYRLILTDLSDYSGVTEYYGFFKITYPDGVIHENTDTNNPDIANGNAVLNIPLRLRKDLILGSYTIEFKVYPDNGFETTSKTFNLTFTDPSLSLRDNSDVNVPSVSFLDTTNVAVTNYNPVITRLISADFPNGGSASTVAIELFMEKDGLYYEGLYIPTLAYNAIYTGTSHEVQWIKSSTFKFNIRGFLGFEELLRQLDVIKKRLDSGNGNKAEFKDDYYMATSLYTHILARLGNDLSYEAKKAAEEAGESITIINNIINEFSGNLEVLQPESSDSNAFDI